MLIDDTYGNYIFKKTRERWKRKFRKANIENKELLQYLDKILTQYPDKNILDLEKEMKNFAIKNNITLNKNVNLLANKKERLCNKAAKEILPFLTGSIKGLSVLHNKNRAHVDAHTQNLYLKQVGKKLKVQLADFDRMVSEKEAQEYYNSTLSDLMCEDIKAIFNHCIKRIVEDLYCLTLEDMPKSFQELCKKVKNGDYSNARNLLYDFYYKNAITDLKNMAKNYEKYKIKKQINLSFC